MNMPDMWAEIEEDQKWRIDELLKLESITPILSKEDDQNQYRRAIVLMLYAHFEGFCKFAFQHYVRAIEIEELTCDDVSIALSVASLSKEFDALNNPNKKSDIFRKPLPDESRLHRFCRQYDFLSNIQTIGKRPVHIPDDVFNTESNLKPAVLQSILYRLGFKHTDYDDFKDQIHMLLNKRNGIGHGSSKEGLSESEYVTLRDACFKIMNGVKHHIMDAIEKKRFLKTNT